MILEMNLSTLRPEGRGLLEVYPEPRFSTPPSKAGLNAAERVNETARRISRLGLAEITDDKDTKTGSDWPCLFFRISTSNRHIPIFPETWTSKRCLLRISLIHLI
jgi:hypothetical protein